MGNVMSGIAEALVATGVGLFVALPAVVAYNMVQKRIGEIENGVGALGKLITAALRTLDHAPAAAKEEREDQEGRGGDKAIVHPAKSNGIAAAAPAES
jgi:biopolymer transport protein ExbB/biopolymer transport protein TolQ